MQGGCEDKGKFITYNKLFSPYFLFLIDHGQLWAGAGVWFSTTILGQKRKG